MGPCNWPVSYAACDEPGGTDDPLDEATRTQVEQMAVEFLWTWTGKRLGTCTVAVRPCLSDCYEARLTTYSGRGPMTSLATPVAPCARCAQPACSCEPGSDAVRLPGPVASVDEVLLDGQVLDPSAYRLRRGDELWRIDGDYWPQCQTMTTSVDLPHTWQVTYQQGVPVPIGGQIAAGVLAEEFGKALCGDNRCQLPKRVQTITRQGVSMAVIDSFEDVGKGRTGIWVIDSWVASQTKAPRRSGVLSPDYPPGYMRDRTSVPRSVR